MSKPLKLGTRLRAIRQEKRFTLQQVGDAVGLSRSFLSQVERDEAALSLGSLKRIADALGIPMIALLERNSQRPDQKAATARGNDARQHQGSAVRIVRKNQRKMLVWPGRTAKTYLLTPDLRGKLEVILDVEEPGHTSGQEYYSHEGEEFGIVLEGTYEVQVAKKRFILEEGDSIYFSSHIPHRVRVLGKESAKTLWVITPPSF